MSVGRVTVRKAWWGKSKLLLSGNGTDPYGTKAGSNEDVVKAGFEG